MAVSRIAQKTGMSQRRRNALLGLALVVIVVGIYLTFVAKAGLFS